MTSTHIIKMKTKVLVATVLAFSCLLPGCAHTPQQRAQREALHAQYARMCRAFKEKDLQTLNQMLTAEATMTLPGGKTVQRKQVLEGWNDWFGQVQSVSTYSHRVQRISATDGEATASVTFAVSFTSVDNQGRPLEFRGNEKSRDTWVKTAEGWKLKHIVAIEGLKGRQVKSGS